MNQQQPQAENDARFMPPQLAQWQYRGLVVGGLGLVLGLAGLFLDQARFFQAYLVAYLFWLGLALGCLAVVMLNHVISSNWGFVVRRLAEAGAMTLPFMAVLFVPLLFGLNTLYEWARPEVMAADEILQQKTWYLNLPFFVIRLVIYFAVWIGLAYFLNRWSDKQDQSGGSAWARRLWILSRYGLVFYVLTATFASFDWGMSLEPHWYSTIYGLTFVVGQGLTALAFVTVALAWLANDKPLSEVVTGDHFNDLGNLLLTFVILWGYIAYSQLIIIWSGNLVEEIPWYLTRIQDGWEWVVLALILFHFVVPFALLLSGRAKRNKGFLAALAGGILVMRLVDLFWLIAPALRESGFQLHWLDVVLPLGLGGFWLAIFSHYLRQKPLLPLHSEREAQTEEVANHA